MKFKELKERLSKMSGSKLTGQELSVYYRENPLAKKAARDPVLKKAIEFALDHGGAMNYAIKNIEKMKRGISRHPQVQQALQFANESVKESAMDTRERKLNIKMKELEYKMKLADFIKDKVEAKVKSKQEKKKLPEAETSELKVSDTSSSTYNKLNKIAKDIGVEISREENHLKVVGDAKKMEEFKSQMSVAMKESKEVKEGTWQIPDSYPELVALQRFLKTPHKAKTAREVHKFHIDVDRFYGDDSFSDMIDAYYHTMPGGDIDPYDKSKVSDKMMARAKSYNKIKPGTDLNIVLMKALTDWTGGDMQFKGNKIVQMPRDWYEKDNPKMRTKSSTVKAKLERKRPRGNLKYKRQDTIMAQVNEGKLTFSEIREMSMRDIVRKHGRELKKAVRLGNLELPMDVENDLYQWAMNNGEVRTDDPDEFIDWLDKNLDDIVKGRIR